MKLSEALERIDACSPALGCLKLTDYDDDLHAAWHELGQVQWMVWLCKELGLPAPIRAQSCDEVRARVAWEQFRDAVKGIGVTHGIPSEHDDPV